MDNIYCKNESSLSVRTKRIVKQMKSGEVESGARLNLNATVKTGVKIFAPTWDMVMQLKYGRISTETYTKQYLAKMRNSFKYNSKMWLDLLKYERIIIGCYCKNGTFCHRYILANIIQKLATARNINCTVWEEISHD